MFNECLIHLFNCTCLNVMCVLIFIWIKPKIFLIILYVLEVIFITLCVHVICLLCFSLFKHVLFWKTKCQNFWLHVLATCRLRDPVTSFGNSFWRLASHETQSRVYTEWFVTHSRLANRELLRNSFLNSFFGGNLF